MKSGESCIGEALNLTQSVCTSDFLELAGRGTQGRERGRGSGVRPAASASAFRGRGRSDISFRCGRSPYITVDSRREYLPYGMLTLSDLVVSPGPVACLS
jgi:hypothetical protein